MQKTFEQGKDEIASLCRYFTTNRDAFHAPGVKEADVCQSLIEPFFEALGWDVRNAAQVAPQYREVIPQESLDVEGEQKKAPDYAFRVGPPLNFFVEAKKCAVDINTDPGARLSDSPLRLERRAERVDPDQFRAICRLRLHASARARRQGEPCSHPPLSGIHGICRPLARIVGHLFAQAVWSGAFDKYAGVQESPSTAHRSGRGVSEGNRGLAGRAGPEHRPAEQGPFFG